MPRNGPSKLDVTVAEQRRSQVMRAVRAAIAEEGLERTTMRNVAERAGVSTGTIAYYFKSKQDMLDAALLDASHEFMECFYREHAAESGSLSLDELVERFLAPENAGAGFVLQMVALGLHNPGLRSVHQWMIEAGRNDIEAAIRRGIESARYRRDIDPELAAAMFHGVLLWWGSELMSNATSQDIARRVGRLALRLLEARSPGEGLTQPATAGKDANAGGTPERIRSILREDAQLPPAAAEALADALEKLYTAVSARPADIR